MKFKILFYLILIVLSSCNYRIYYNSQLNRKESISHLIDEKIQGVSMFELDDSIPNGAKLCKVVDLQSPFFWSEASFYNPSDLMFNLAKRETKKLNCNILYIDKIKVSKFTRYKLSVKIYSLEEPYISIYNNQIDSNIAANKDYCLLNIRMMKGEKVSKVCYNDSIICTSKEFKFNNNSNISSIRNFRFNHNGKLSLCNKTDLDELSEDSSYNANLNLKTGNEYLFLVADKHLFKINKDFNNNRIAPIGLDSTVVFPKRGNSLLLNKRNDIGFNIAAIAGAWIPTGDLKILGVHPELGFQGGIKSKNYSGQFTLVIKFLNTPNTYLAKDTSKNIWVPTNTFVGPYIGLDLGRNLFTRDNYEFQILGGFGFDAFTALEDIYENSGSQDVRSSNLNFGLGYKYYFISQKYVGIESKYNIVDYSGTGITNLKDNFISIRLSYGFVGWP